MYPALADTFSLLFYFFFWWAIVAMFNVSLAAYGLAHFAWVTDAILGAALSYLTVLVSKLGSGNL